MIFAFEFGFVNFSLTNLGTSFISWSSLTDEPSTEIIYFIHCSRVWYIYAKLTLLKMNSFKCFDIFLRKNVESSSNKVIHKYFAHFIPIFTIQFLSSPNICTLDKSLISHIIPRKIQIFLTSYWVGFGQWKFDGF